MNRKNLRKLANYLLNLPEGYEHFDMDSYVVANSLSWGKEDYPLNMSPAVYKECGAIACAAGHGPAAGIRPLKFEDWAEYVNRAFMLVGSQEYDWCFECYWGVVDNTPTGAALRILYLLDNGLPEDWRFDKKTKKLYTDFYEV